MQYYLVPRALQRHIQQIMYYVGISGAVDRHMSQSKDVFYRLYNKPFDGRSQEDVEEADLEQLLRAVEPQERKAWRSCV